ncbi:MAG: TlpA disulfide reductase family protein [Pseudomonadota bacterium]
MKPLSIRSLQVIALIGVIATSLVSLQSHAVERIKLPDFELADMNDESFNSADYRGKVLMVNFWATWCPPCIEEIPSMQALKDHLKDQPFELLAINMGESADAVRKFAETLETPINFPLLVDETLGVVGDWRVRGLPTTIIVDKTGKVAFFTRGPRDWNSEEIREKIRQFMDETPI